MQGFSFKMKIHVICIGKTNALYLREGIALYMQRLVHYCKMEWTEIKDVGISEPSQQKLREGEQILRMLKPEDHVILLDERGTSYTSRKFSEFLQKKQNAGTKTLVLVIGGAFGFSDSVYARADGKIAFSEMTFSHEMIRLLLVEQLYRGFSILKGESYHHD